MPPLFKFMCQNVSKMQTGWLKVYYQACRSFHPSAGWSRWDRHSWRLWEQEPGDRGGCSLHYSLNMGCALQMETHKQTRLTHRPSFYVTLEAGNGNQRNWGKRNRNTQLADTDSETLQETQEEPRMSARSVRFQFGMSPRGSLPSQPVIWVQFTCNPPSVSRDTGSELWETAAKISKAATGGDFIFFVTRDCTSQAWCYKYEGSGTFFILYISYLWYCSTWDLNMSSKCKWSGVHELILIYRE